MGKNITRTRFQPTSRKIQLRLDNKPGTPTTIFYQKGTVENYIALRFFKKGKIIRTMISKEQESWDLVDSTNIWNLIREMGGQRPDKAHIQRENSLTQIVRNYFEGMGYTVQEQPCLVENTPDLFVKKGKFIGFIELKAYFGRTLVAEAEFSQILKYFAIYESDKELAEQIRNGEVNPPKFFLISTGKLLPVQDNSLLNGDLDNLEYKDQVTFIKTKYRSYLRSLTLGRSLEARDTRSIYYYAHKKFEKYYIENNWGNPKVCQLEHPVPMDIILEDKDGFQEKGYQVFIIPPSIFEMELKQAGLRKEVTVFNKIRKTWMERLIMDRNLIELSENSKKN